LSPTLGAALAAASVLLFGAAAGAAAPGGRTCAGACFQLNAVSIEGATVYKPGELAPAYADYLTREVDTSDLVKIAAAITDRYRRDGYFLSRAAVPVQAPGGRIGRIRVYEGYIGEVSASGDGAEMAARLLRPLQGRRPLKLVELQKALLQAAQRPGLQLKTQLEPDPADPARHRLVVKASLKRLVVSAYSDNRGPQSAGPWQATLRAALNSVLRSGDQLAFAVMSVPNHVRRFAYGEASYSTPVGKGLRLRGTLGVSDSQTRSGQPIAALAGGSSWEATLGLDKLWTLGRQAQAYASLLLDRRQVEHRWSPAAAYRDDILALRGRVGYGEAKAKQSAGGFVQLSAGTVERPGPGARPLSRPDASRQFVKVNAHAQHYRDIGKHAGVFVAADAQWSPSRLPLSEDFFVGGAPYGRGYNYAALAGDKGVAGTIELRAGFDPKLKGISFLQGYTFVDAGKVWGGPFAQKEAIVSAGGGIRVRMANHATLGLEAARRLDHAPSDPKRGWRPTVYLSMEF
jgi:hemolysin activation/secretion protein